MKLMDDANGKRKKEKRGTRTIKPSIKVFSSSAQRAGTQERKEDGEFCGLFWGLGVGDRECVKNTLLLTKDRQRYHIAREAR